MLRQKNHNNPSAWQIDSQEKQITSSNEEPDRIFSMILNLRKTYTK